jgi:hypothetical protein
MTRPLVPFGRRKTGADAPDALGARVYKSASRSRVRDAQLPGAVPPRHRGRGDRDQQEQRRLDMDEQFHASDVGDLGAK